MGQNQKATTLQDIATHVGLTRRTVSRIMNDEPGHSAATRATVLAAAAELKYRPNRAARALSTNTTGLIGFLAPSLNDPFFADVAESVQRAARQHGQTMLFAMHDNDVDLQDEVLKALDAHRPDGIIILPAQDRTEPLVPWLDSGTSMVAIGADPKHDRCATISYDHEHGTRLAVDHLLADGRRRIGMLSTDAFPDLGGSREMTFKAAVPPSMLGGIEHSDTTWEGGQLGTQRLLEQHSDLDAIFAYNDTMAFGALDTLRRFDRRVPADVAVVGYDDLAPARHMSPPLTTIRIDRERLGVEAVRRLTLLSSGRDGEAASPRPFVLPVELVVRDSA